MCVVTYVEIKVQSTLGQGTEYNKFTVQSSKCKVHRSKNVPVPIHRK